MRLYALVSCLLEPYGARSADRGAAAVVLVVGGDVVDAGVQPHGVVLDAQALQLGVEDSRVAGVDKVGPALPSRADERG